MAQRVDSLPQDMRARVRAFIAERQAEQKAKELKAAGSAGAGAGGGEGGTGGRKITVPIMDEVENIGDNEKVSAAILAKVLEERAKERSDKNKFCIDVGTQTHGWHFPDNKIAGGGGGQSQQQQNREATTTASSSATGSPEEQRVVKTAPAKRTSSASRQRNAAGPSSASASTKPGGEESTAEVIQILRSISMDSAAADCGTVLPGGSRTEAAQDSGVGNILVASVIRSPPARDSDGSSSSESTSCSGESGGGGDEEDSDCAEAHMRLTAGLAERRGVAVAAVSPPSSADDRPRSARTQIMTRSATFSAVQTDI